MCKVTSTSVLAQKINNYNKFLNSALACKQKSWRISSLPQQISCRNTNFNNTVLIFSKLVWLRTNFRQICLAIRLWSKKRRNSAHQASYASKTFQSLTRSLNLVFQLWYGCSPHPGIWHNLKTCTRYDLSPLTTRLLSSCLRTPKWSKSRPYYSQQLSWKFPKKTQNHNG